MRINFVAWQDGLIESDEHDLSTTLFSRRRDLLLVSLTILCGAIPSKAWKNADLYAGLLITISAHS